MSSTIFQFCSCLYFEISNWFNFTKICQARKKAMNNSQPKTIGCQPSHMVLVARKSNWLHADNKGAGSAVWSAPFYSLSWKYDDSTRQAQNFDILASVRSFADWFQSYFVGNPEDSFPLVEDHMGRDARKPVFRVYEQRADQPAHPRRLISAFVIRLLESIISKLATSEISIVIVAKRVGSVSLCWKHRRPVLSRRGPYYTMIMLQHLMNLFRMFAIAFLTYTCEDTLDNYLSL